MTCKAAAVSALAAVLGLTACPGSTSGLCQGVTCAPGRTCIDGVHGSSSGSYCYRAGQKTDEDGSDLTVGCCCT